MIYTILVDIDSNVVKWPKTLHLIREGYFQGMVEGNECRRLLKSIPHLRSILELSGKLNEALPLVESLDAFSSIVSMRHRRHSKIEEGDRCLSSTLETNRTEAHSQSTYHLRSLVQFHRTS